MADTMTLRQLADYLQMSIDSVYHLVRRGKIPGVKIGKQWRFSKAAIDRWLASSATQTARVLLVAGDEIISEVILNALHSRGHQSVGVSTVEQSGTLLAQVAFDVVIVDLALPEGSAADVMEQILSLPDPPDALVISGYEDQEVLRRVKQMLPYIVMLNKPLDLGSLVELVSERARRR